MVELDILRAFAIIIIVFSHYGFFLPTAKIPYYGLLTYFGIALFLFISGFVLYLNHPSFPQRNSLTDFYKKRALRIFPLYWLVIALQFVSARALPSRIDFITILGLQGFLSPRFNETGMAYWWFIGVIVVLYAIYPLISALGSDKLNLPPPIDSDVFKFGIMLIVPFLILVAARGALSIIADEVFVFYGIFALGVAVSKYNVLGRYGFLTDNRRRLFKYIAAAAVSLTALLFIYGLSRPSANVSAVSRFASYGGLLVVETALFLLFALFVFCLARMIVVSSSKASKPPSRAVWYRVLLLISFSSYAIYLFFGYILASLTLPALTSAQLTALEIDIIQIFVGLPTVVLVAYLLQSTQNEIVNRVRKYRTASAPPSE